MAKKNEDLLVWERNFRISRTYIPRSGAFRTSCVALEHLDGQAA